MTEKYVAYYRVSTKKQGASGLGLEAQQKAVHELAAYHGVKLGSAREGHWEGREHLRDAGIKKAQPMGSAVNAQTARDHYGAGIVPKLKQWRGEGRSLDEIAALLNAEGFTTRRDKKAFTKAIVWRLIDRYLGEEYLGSRRPLACAAGY